MRATERTYVEWEAEDDVKGGPLDPHGVKIASQKKLRYLWDRNVHEYATVAEARAQTGRNTVGLKWTDTNKNSTEFPRHRSRLVCTEVRHKGVEQVFSAAPPLEALRVLISISRQEDVPQVADPLLISIADVSKAQFNADAVRNVHVRLPEEDSTMCRTLDAATVERALCTGLRRRRILTRPGIPVPLLPQGLTDLVHGDNCLIVGREHALDLLQAVYELSKVVTLGPGPSHSQAVTFLGRTQTLRKWRIQYEPDKQHVPRSLKALGLTGVRCVAIPGTDDVGERIK